MNTILNPVWNPVWNPVRAPRLPSWDDPRLPSPFHRACGPLRVAACLATPAGEAIGGDFYDCFTLDDGRLAVAVGDVCGHGPAAAVRVLAVQCALRLLLRRDGRPGAALARLNDLLCREQAADPGPAWPVALAVAVVDPLSGAVQAAAAGAEPPLALRHAGGWDRAEAGGLLLGVRADEVYPVAALRLGPGDALLLVTDGVTEARHRRECLGYDGLTFLAAVGMAAAPPEPAAAARHLTHAVLGGARTYAGGALRDDACLLAVLRAPALPASLFH